TSFTAIRPPNCTVMFSATSALGIAPPNRACAQRAHEAAWHEQDDDDDQEPVDEEVGLCGSVAEEFRCEGERRGADERPGEGGAAADDGDQRDAHAQVRLEHGLRLQGREEDAVDAAAYRGEGA